jgi:cellulose biosynthesis protein BcsQ
MKGGVGKTAAAVNLAYLVAQSGAKTLICDLDPQGSVTYYFRIKPEVKAGAKVLTKGGKHIARNIKGTDYDHLDLLPADLSQRHLATQLDQVKRSKRRFRDILAPLQQEYTYIILDCPPTISLVADNIVMAADWLLVPIIPTTLSVHAYNQLLAFFRKQKYKPDKIVAFFSMVERRKTMHQTVMEELWEHDPHFLNSTIPYAADIEKMGLHREPVAAFAPSSTSARAYHHLWDELQGRISEPVSGQANRKSRARADSQPTPE